ncbi:MAG: hypothetical protein Q8P41_25575 [Pseudomonadota bacterium]|nr:hypothetical protein [Pseudomonadota bacterium]
MKVFPLAMLAALVLSAPAFAHPSGHDGGDYYRPSSTAAAPAPTVIPATYPEVVAALRERATAAGVALDGQKIVDVRRAVTALTDLSAALPAKATGLSAAAKATVAQKATSLKTNIDALLIAADKGNVSNGKAALAGIQADLDALGPLAK